MASITGGAWNKDLPSGGSNIALGDQDIRSNNSSVQDTFEEEHYFSTSSASAGIHKIGSARAYMPVTTSGLSNPTGDGDGRIAYVEADNALWISNGSNSTWTLVTNSITVATANDWTALQTFASAEISSSTVTTNELTVGSAGAPLLSITTHAAVFPSGMGNVTGGSSHITTLTALGADEGDVAFVNGIEAVDNSFIYTVQSVDTDANGIKVMLSNISTGDIAMGSNHTCIVTFIQMVP